MTHEFGQGRLSCSRVATMYNNSIFMAEGFLLGIFSSGVFGFGWFLLWRWGMTHPHSRYISRLRCQDAGPDWPSASASHWDSCLCFHFLFSEFAYSLFSGLRFLVASF
ncbi:hypothetical protein B0J11DRAFT_288492 [Dendryphion nanum]|uniref:Uncharacterized protein n=1 Tax=Dendryphion nanum TaxID=256645 RepID=A0A9P9IPT9_9PLEO|nr:hypothetical protein B0J11DRAFT_288492 [Dendryphion nanum]